VYNDHPWGSKIVIVVQSYLYVIKIEMGPQISVVVGSRSINQVCLYDVLIWSSILPLSMVHQDVYSISIS